MLNVDDRDGYDDDDDAEEVDTFRYAHRILSEVEVWVVPDASVSPSTLVHWCTWVVAAYCYHLLDHKSLNPLQGDAQGTNHPLRYILDP